MSKWYKPKFNKWQYLWVVSGILALMLNPLTVQVFLEYILWVFTGLSILFGTYFCIFALYAAFSMHRVNIPKKSKKNVVKSKDYLTETR